jgi:hypothetical protein
MDSKIFRKEHLCSYNQEVLSLKRLAKKLSSSISQCNMISPRNWVTISGITEGQTRCYRAYRVCRFRMQPDANTYKCNKQVCSFT